VSNDSDTTSTGNPLDGISQISPDVIDKTGFARN